MASRYPEHEEGTKRRIFVFGSNTAGRHGAGAALFAKKEHGAVYGVGEGITGDSYALPTCDERFRALPLGTISGHVDKFLAVARERQDLIFDLTRVGCGLAGYAEGDIRPMFDSAPDNVDFTLWEQWSRRAP